MTKKIILISTLVFFMAIIFAAIINTNSQPSAGDTKVASYQNQYQNCPNYDCVKTAIGAVIEASGPQAALQNMTTIMDSLPFSFDDHQFAHEVGRQTAKIKGISGESFLSCSTDFNYGCQHGFFEYALSETSSSEEAASKVCANLPQNLPTKSHFYCYHGLGHGIMMANTNNLIKSLAICNSLDQAGQEGCWQGVFMENVNAQLRGEAQDGTFSQNDPLAPCNNLDQKYRLQCYLNHAGYLMWYHQADFQKAAASCANADESSISSCLQSLGLMVSNPTWQLTIAGEEVEDTPTTYIRFCQKFPKGRENECIIGTVDNIMNFDQLDVDKRAIPFCQIVEKSLQLDCFKHIVYGFKNQATEQNQVSGLCAKIAVYSKEACQSI